MPTGIRRKGPVKRTEDTNLDKAVDYLAEQASCGAEILSKARMSAVAKGVMGLPYLMALFIEFSTLRKETVREFGEESVTGLERRLRELLDSGWSFARPRTMPDPMYA